MAKKRRRRKKQSNLYIVIVVLVFIVMAASIAGVWVVFQKLDANEKAARQARQEALKQQEEEEKTAKEENAKQVQEEIENDTTEKVAKMSLLDEEPSGSLDQLTVSDATATSELEQSSGTVNEAGLAFDGDKSTSWQEGAEDDGIDESITANLDGTDTITYICFHLGNWQDEDYYQLNNRPKSLEITAGSTTATISFDDEMEEQWVQMPTGTSADSVTFTIKSVYNGDEWQDTCISEIEIYGSTGDSSESDSSSTDSSSSDSQ